MLAGTGSPARGLPDGAPVRSIPAVLRDGGGCNDMGRLRQEERECLLPWVCSGQIRGGLVHAPRRDGHRMRGANRRPDQAVPDGALESLVSQMREKLIAGLHAAFLGGAADGLYSHAFTRVRVSAVL